MLEIDDEVAPRFSYEYEYKTQKCIVTLQRLRMHITDERLVIDLEMILD